MFNHNSATLVSMPTLWAGVLAFPLCFLFASQSHSAADVDPMLRKILSDWQERRDTTSSVKYLVKGEKLTPKGTYTGERHLPPEVTGEFPPEDRRVEKTTQWMLDFEKNWVKKEIKELRLVLPKAEFLPVHEITFYDGKSVRQYKPKLVFNTPFF